MALEEKLTTNFTNGQLINNVMKALQEQRKICRFCDVILKVCDEEIFAHSNVLAAASPYFASFLGILQDLPRAFSQKLPQIIEIQIEGSNDSRTGYGLAVRKLVDYMYTSYIDISPSVLTQVSEIAKIMQMDTILEYCEKILKLDNRPSAGDANVSSTLNNKENRPDLKSGDHTYGLDHVNAFFPRELSAMNISQEGDQIFTQTNNLKTTKLINNIDPDMTHDKKDSSVKAKQTLVSNSPKPDEEGSNINTTVATNTTEEIAPKLNADFDPAGAASETLINPEKYKTIASSETPEEDDSLTAVVAVITKEQTKEGDEKIDSDGTVESDPTKASEQCSGTVRSSLRIRLSRKHTKVRPNYRKKCKVKPRLTTTANNNVNSETQNNGSTTVSTTSDLFCTTTTTTKDNVTVEVYMCNECLYSTYSQKNFKRHEKIHLEGRYACDMCDFRSYRMKALHDHRRMHLHAKLQCSYCDYKAINDEELTLHLTYHTGDNPYYCYICDMKFKTRTQLKQHMPKHSDEKPFICNVCYTGFKWKHALKSHMVVHANTKDHLCDICGFATAHKSQLKAHRLIHTGETFKCTMQGCNFQALKRQNLKYHMLTHTHEKPHACCVCNQNFSLVKNLRRHMLLHTEDRPFKCEHCSFKSTRFDKLKEHLLKQHNIGERPSKKHRISDFQVDDPVEEVDENTLRAVATVATEDNSTTIPGTTTQIVIGSADNLQVPIAITSVNSDGYTEISYPTFQYVQ